MTRERESFTSELAGAASLDQLYALMAEADMTPGWIERRSPILWPEPRTAFVPAHWRYRESRAGLLAAGQLIDTKLAERRNLLLRNPIAGNETATLRTLICAYQSILPGEKARSHRHSPHALRVILDADGAWSIVNGEKHPMQSGDIVLTPGGSWHGHGHDGDQQAFWFDGLDVPLVGLLEPMFYEDHPDTYEAARRVTPDSPFRFTWESTVRGLDRAPPDPERVNGRAIVLAAPQMPTLSLSVHRLAADEQTRASREAANNVFVVMQGRGRSHVGAATFNWERGDTFCAPMWHRLEHCAETEAVLFRMSDAPLMRYCGYHRRELL